MLGAHDTNAPGNTVLTEGQGPFTTNGGKRHLAGETFLNNRRHLPVKIAKRNRPSNVEIARKFKLSRFLFQPWFCELLLAGFLVFFRTHQRSIRFFLAVPDNVGWRVPFTIFRIHRPNAKVFCRVASNLT